MNKAIELLTEAVKDLAYAMQLNFNKLNERISKLEKDSKPKIDFYGYSYKGEPFLDIFVDGERVKHCHIDVECFMMRGAKMMSKYKVGDKVVMEITDEISVMEEPDYILSDATVVNKGYIDKAAEPLSTYTEPLEAKIRRQAAEITRLLEENKELKEDKAVLNAKIDAYKLYGDQHEEEYNQTFNKGAEAAWEMARKISLSEIYDGYSNNELKEIFDSICLDKIFNSTYTEAATKVEEWENAKEEIKRGDIIRNKYNTSSKFCVTDISCDGHLYGVGRYGLIYSNQDPEYWEKTGRHMDIDNFLKQISGEEK